MTPTVRIRPATTRDIPRILPLWDALATLHGALDPALAVVEGSAQVYGDFLRAIIGQTDTCMMLGVEDERIVAFALGRIQLFPLPLRDQRRGWIQDVFTIPERRRLGVGRRVVEELLAWFLAHGVPLVELTVAVGNDEALRFWEALGFVTYMYRMKYTRVP
jgi:ribosomal protein S18 acetylase RimI-like enzyme